MYKSQSTYKLL